MQRPQTPTGDSDPLPFAEDETIRTVTRRLLRVAELVGDRPAMSGPDSCLTFGELAEVTRGVGAWLRSQHGSGPEAVAVLMSHGTSNVTAQLAAMAAGRPAMPLDPVLPPAHLGDQIAGARPVALVCDEAHEELALALGPGCPVHVWGPPGSMPRADGAGLDPDPDGGTVVLFTSGTTGRPKGVAVNHRAFLQGARDLNRGRVYTPADRVGNIVPLTFGAGVATSMWSLLSGAEMCLFGLRENGLPAVARWLRDERITNFSAVPTIARALASEVGDSPLPALRTAVIGGEAVQPVDVPVIRGLGEGPVRIVTVYASTELMLMAWGSIAADVDAVGIGSVGVGTPVTGYDLGLDLLDDDDVGEVLVTAPPLNLGYLEEAGHRSAEVEGGRVTYRTGDLGRRAPAGIVLVGRVDSMVKIRGSRVELGAVEQALMSAPGVGAAAAVPTQEPNGDTALVAHVTSAHPDEPADPRRVRGHLRTNLPAAMVPLRVVVHDALPQLPNGKVDRTALAEHAAPAVARSDARLPGSELERRLLKRLKLLTAIEDLGVADDLFERGVDSLSAIEILVQVEEEFGVELPPSSWIDLATVADLARAVERGGIRGPASGVVPLQTGDPSRPVLVITNDLHGSALRFRELATALGPDQPVIGLDSPLRSGWPGSPVTVEGLAEHHADELEAVLGDGPVNLLGYSWGTLLAVELTRVFQARGRQVGFLGLVDYGPNHLRHRLRGRGRPIPPDGWRERAPSDLGLPERVVHHARRLMELPPGRRSRYLSRVVGQSRRFDVRVARSDLRRRGRVRPELRSSYGWHQLVDVAQRFRFRPIDHDGTVFVSDQTRKGRITASRKLDYGSVTDPTLGWDRIIRGRLDVVDVVGHHNDLVEEPYVGGVGAVVRRRFDEWLATENDG